MTLAHRSSNYIVADLVQAQPRVNLGNADTFQHDSQYQSHRVGQLRLGALGEIP